MEECKAVARGRHPSLGKGHIDKVLKEKDYNNQLSGNRVARALDGVEGLSGGVACLKNLLSGLVLR